MTVYQSVPFKPELQKIHLKFSPSALNGVIPSVASSVSPAFPPTHVTMTVMVVIVRMDAGILARVMGHLGRKDTMGVGRKSNLFK